MKYQVLDHEVSLDEIKKIEFGNKKIGVIIHIEDLSGNILLQKRGADARDEIGLLEDIGGDWRIPMNHLKRP